MQLNASALACLRDAISSERDLGITRHVIAGATVYDCGVEAAGSDAAGVLLARVAMADLGDVGVDPAGSPRLFPHEPRTEGVDVRTAEDGVAGVWQRPVVHVTSRSPVAACLASQYAGWRVATKGYMAMASGPVRAAIGREPLFDLIGLRESPSEAVGLLEASALPPAEVVASLAKAARIPAERLTLLVAPTASAAGTLQVVARSLETALHKLETLGFDLSRVVGGRGRAPLPPVPEDDLTAIGRTNDSILYGSHVELELLGVDEPLLAATGAAMTSSASAAHGKTFATLFRDAGGDFYAIDPALFAPAVVDLIDRESGLRLRFGSIEAELVSQSFGLPAGGT